MPRKKFKHIELFAGCGGMSLGLDAAGFDLFMANEISPMAGETFAFNLIGENLSLLAEQKKKSQKVLWVKSTFSDEKLHDRLRENPKNFSHGKFSDLSPNIQFAKKLIIGNIDHLLNFLNENSEACLQLKNQNIDLLSGGPPCQGFSLAGKRIKDDDKNLLPMSFSDFAGMIQPKVVLLENVRGITSPFQTGDKVNHYAWLEVAKAFSLKCFVPVCMLLNSKYFGVPQNRPRFILIAFRIDIFHKLHGKSSNTALTKSILSNSLMFYDKVQRHREQLEAIQLSDITLYDIESNPEFFDGKLLPKIRTIETEFINSAAAINDITSTTKKYNLEDLNSNYSLELKRIFPPQFENEFTELQNHLQRNHSFKVKARFRLFQALNNMNGLKHDAMKVLSGSCTDELVIRRVFNGLKNEDLLVKSNGSETFQRPINLSEFKEYIKEIVSKKHSQRALKHNEPAPAQLTIPDDLCHYSTYELRTLTVREMARFQSFPDWFVFRSKVTTGGNQRSIEVPQYTQVGNAVPPLLAYELGLTISTLLKTIR
jgi:DNA (cytosine-5)-methyltransferase 1